MQWEASEDMWVPLASYRPLPSFAAGCLRGSIRPAFAPCGQLLLGGTGRMEVSSTSKQSLIDAFRLYGKAPADGVTLAELTALLTRRTSQDTQLVPANIQTLFSNADTGGCGTVPCEIFAATWSRAPLDRALLLQSVFDLIDYAQSGVLDMAEFVALSQGMESIAMQNVFALVKASSESEHGAMHLQHGALHLSDFVNFNLESGKGLSDAEFQKWQASVWLTVVLKRARIDRSALLSNTFHWCDVNNDGVLEVHEFLALSTAQDEQTIAMQQSVFAKADTSGDGKLQEDEFVQHNLETGKALSDFDFAQQLRMWTTLARLRA